MFAIHQLRILSFENVAYDILKAVGLIKITKQGIISKLVTLGGMRTSQEHEEQEPRNGWRRRKG